MNKVFFAYWFKGLNKALSKLNDESIDTMLTECGKAYSESYTKQIYIDEYKKAKDLNDFLTHLKNNFKEIKINKISENKLEIIYSFCACDIVKHGFVSNPKFCICSQIGRRY